MSLGPEVPAEEMTDEEMLTQFDKLAQLGVIEYIVPSTPIGERWVVGVEGRIANLDTKEAFGFLLGSTATAHWAAAHLGVEV